MRKQVFTSQAAAQAAYDTDPVSISMTGYPAGEGYEASYTVYFDDDANDSFAQSPREMSLTELFAPLERAHEKQVRAEAIEVLCRIGSSEIVEGLIKCFFDVLCRIGSSEKQPR